VGRGQVLFAFAYWFVIQACAVDAQHLTLPPNFSREVPEPAANLDRHAMLRGALAALNQLPQAAAQFRKNLPPRSQPILAQLEEGVRKALNPKEAYNMVPAEIPKRLSTV